MKKIIMTALATLITFYGYSQTPQYLPLTGGSMVQGASINISGNDPGNGYIQFNNSLSSNNRVFRLVAGNTNISQDGFSIYDATAGITRYILDASGNSTWTGSGTFGGALTLPTTSSFPGPLTNSGKLYYSSSSGLIAYGAGTLNDFTLLNKNGHGVFEVPTGTTNLLLGGTLTGTSASFGGGSIASTTATNISQFNDIRINGNHPDASTNAITYQSGGGGGAAIAFFRGGSYDTGIKFYTNSYTGGAGALQVAMSIDPNKNVNVVGTLIGTAANFTNNVAIGTTQTNSNLYVHGTIKSKEVKVEATLTIPDYVFEKSYNLQSLPEVEKYITENKHLSEIPSAKEIQKDGINVGDMQLSLLKKIEELTLHLIEQNKLNIQQTKRIEELEKQLKK